MTLRIEIHILVTSHLAMMLTAAIFMFLFVGKAGNFDQFISKKVVIIFPQKNFFLKEANWTGKKTISILRLLKETHNIYTYSCKAPGT